MYAITIIEIRKIPYEAAQIKGVEKTVRAIHLHLWLDEILYNPTRLKRS